MPNIKPRPTGSTVADPLQPLIDRVRGRVAEAGLALDRRATASRPKSKRAGQPRLAPLSLPTSQSPEAAREAHALRNVFRDLGDTHRQYRRRTGQPGAPALRDAAYAFREAPSLTSLVAVAAFLDELGILAW